MTRLNTTLWLCIGVIFVAGFHSSAAAAEWRAADGPLVTRWAKKVSPDIMHAEHPRPQMVRTNWKTPDIWPRREFELKEGLFIRVLYPFGPKKEHVVCLP